MITNAVLVEGTFGGDWAHSKSAFCHLLRTNDFAPMRFQGWSGNVSGVPNILSNRKHADWIAGGYALSYFLRGLDYADRNIICHSHGLNVVLYACVREKLEIRRLISVCSPVRNDMRTQARGAAGRIGHWRHVASQNGDIMQRLGELFDGHWGWTERCWNIPGVENLIIPGIGHSKLLNDKKFLDLWQSDGMFDLLRAQEVHVAESV